MSLTSWESAGLTLLESLVSIIAPLAQSRNPAYSGVISAASSAVTGELASIAAGNAPTLHDPNVAQAAASVLGGIGTAAIRNTGNATTASLIGAGTAAAESAIAQALNPPQTTTGPGQPGAPVPATT